MSENLSASRVVSLPERVEQLLIKGDLKSLSSEERVVYYNGLCKSLGLNPLTKPFDYIEFQGRLQLYARKDCTEQLRKLYGVAITSIEDQLIGEVYRVKASAKDASGRTDFAIGAVSVKGLAADGLANAYMKAETKAKRRVTLSICGLGMLDECEVETIPGVRTETAAPAPASTPVRLTPGTPTNGVAQPHQVEEIKKLWLELKREPEALKETIQRKGYQRLAEMPFKVAEELISALKFRVTQAQGAEAF